MQQAEEAAAIAEAERGRRLHLVGEAGVVEAQLADRGAQILEIGGVDREQAAEHHRLRRLEAGQRVRGRAAVLGDGVADAGVGHFLDRAGEEAELAGAELVDIELVGGEDAGALDQMLCAGAHHADVLALLQHAVDDADQHDDAEIGVVPAVDQHGLERLAGIALARRRQLVDDRLQHVGDAEAGLGRDQHGLAGVDADHLLDLLADALGLGGRQVDLVQHHDDLVVVVDRLVDVGQRLRLDALAGVDHQQRALAGGERARHLIGEVDMAGRVDQVEDVVLAIVGLVVEAHGLRLDGDAALALDVHVVEHLLLHVAQLEAAGRLDQAVGQRRLAVVDMGDDCEIADVGNGGAHGAPRLPAAFRGESGKAANLCSGSECLTGNRAQGLRSACAPPSVLPDICPTGGGDRRCRRCRFACDAMRWRKRVTAADLPPCAGDVRQHRGGREEARLA